MKINKENNITKTDVLIGLAFELGQAYQRIYSKIGLDNILDFNDIAFAKSLGAEFKFKGDMSDLPKLFKTKNIKKERIIALNEIANNLQILKDIANKET